MLHRCRRQGGENHDALRARIGEEDGKMSMRLVQPEFTIATSDGIRSGAECAIR